MKKLNSVILLILLCVSCLPVEEDDDTQLRQWKMTGKATFTGDATSDVKYGLFYVASATMPSSLTTSHTLVSNAVNLGQSASAEVTFTMSVDCTKTKPSDNYLLMMFMWRDTDNDNEFDSGEASSQVICSAGSGSESFIGDSTDDVICHYLYDLEYNTENGTTKGWNQVAGTDKYINVKNLATKQSGEYYLPYAVVKSKSSL